MGMIVLVRGELNGMGRHASCGLVAIQKTLAQPKFRREPEHVYTDYGVIEAPTDLPDGEYTVRIGKQELTTKKQHGIWLTCSETAKC